MKPLREMRENCASVIKLPELGKELNRTCTKISQFNEKSVWNLYAQKPTWSIFPRKTHCYNSQWTLSKRKTNNALRLNQNEIELNENKLDYVINKRKKNTNKASLLSRVEFLIKYF